MSLPRQHTNPYAAVSPSGGPNSSYRQSPTSPTGIGSGGGFSGQSSSSASSGVRAGTRFLKRLFKFPQMDFEVAVWEMTQLMIAPRKVWRQVMYRKQTKNQYANSDPAFPYLLCFFVGLTSFAWSVAYAQPSVTNILRIALWFVFVHCLLSCLGIATVMWLFAARVFGPNGILVGRVGGFGGRRRGLFGVHGPAGADGEEALEWGFCFDVAIRAFLPPWVYLYVLQFLLLPAVASHHWPSTLLANTIYLLAGLHTTYITFLGYNSLPALSSSATNSHLHLLLAAPIAFFTICWIIATTTGWNASLHLAPVLWCAADLRKTVGGSVQWYHLPG